MLLLKLKKKKINSRICIMLYRTREFKHNIVSLILLFVGIINQAAHTHRPLNLIIIYVRNILYTIAAIFGFFFFLNIIFRRTAAVFLSALTCTCELAAV